MIIYNRFIFIFPSNYIIELIYILIDYTIIFILFVRIFVSVIIINNCINRFFNFYINEYSELEMIWSIIPFIILIFISLPTLKTLYTMENCEFCGITVKIMGYQWYWSYSLDIIKEWKFNRYIKSDKYIMRLIESDNRLILPIFLPLKFLITSNDVIHSWTIPSAAIKIDAIPGRINQLCFSIRKMGKFFGQCSEICGSNHRFIPISLEVVNFEDFYKIIYTSS